MVIKRSTSGSKIPNAARNRSDRSEVNVWKIISLILGVPAMIVALLTIPSLISKNCSHHVEIKKSEFVKEIKKDTTFKIINYPLFDEIINTIEKESNYVYNDTSKRIFEITYSGYLDSMRNNYYKYNGGNLVIKLNGIVVYGNKSLWLEKTLPNGTLKNEIDAELNRRLNMIVKSNHELLAKEIILILER